MQGQQERLLEAAATAVEEYGSGGVGESRRGQAVAIQEKSDSDRERRLRGRKVEMGTSARPGTAKALQGRRVSVPNGTKQAPWERQRPKSGP